MVLELAFLPDDESMAPIGFFVVDADASSMDDRIELAKSFARAVMKAARGDGRGVRMRSDGTASIRLRGEREWTLRLRLAFDEFLKGEGFDEEAAVMGVELITGSIRTDKLDMAIDAIDARAVASAFVAAAWAEAERLTSQGGDYFERIELA
ncbi:MAG: hypothetical protein AAGK04_04950 [Planctomycetota bacterium]